MDGLCRVLLLLSFSLFWGGLTFYTGLVVRITHDVLSQSMEGGLITQRVTQWLQLLGVLTCLLMFCNAALVAGNSKRFGRWLFVCSTLLAASVAGLFVVHGQLDAVIDVEQQVVTDRDAFTIAHRRYNQLTTVEWLSSLIYLPVTVLAWRSVDAAAADPAA